MSGDQLALWREFRDASSLDHPFLSFGFTRCVSQIRPDVHVCVIESDGRVEAFFPFQFAGRWGQALHAAEPIGGSMSNYFGIVGRPGFRIASNELLAAAGIDAMHFHHLAEEQLDFGLSGEQPRSGHRIVIGNDPVEYWRKLKAANRNFVAELDRRQRRASETFGPLRFEFAVADPVDNLTRLIAAKRNQYRASGVGDALAASWKRALLFELARSSDPDCTGVLSELYMGDTLAASHFGLRSRHTLQYWFPVYHRALSKLAPGHLLLRHILEEGATRGIRVIDRGEGDQPHKAAWVTEQRTFYRGLWQRPSMRAFAFRVGQAIAWRVRQKVQHSAEQLGRSKEHPKGQ
jgi:CelD/BcsL family acetyltransferase involved in cellulose biosynthesis